MTKAELKKLIDKHTTCASDFEAIWYAVEKYTDASNGAKPDVMCSVCPDCRAYNKKTDDELTKCWNCGEGYRAN